ncbi:HIT domain containing protein [Fragilaria crotonensis]|nr:HIT domain containing protein [Fragilaria crotonensis]
MVFAKHMFPKFGFPDALPSKLDAWFERVKLSDPVFKRVFDEVHGGLLQWEERKRWDPIWLAGVRDEAPATLFDKIISGLTNIRKASPEHIEILGRLMVAAGEIANDTELGFGDGARIVINDGTDGGQEVMHLHIHVLGGRAMTWPPG